MCGIIGAVKRTGGASKEVYEGLKRLEYRGYDSAGIASREDGRLYCRKRGGRVIGLEDAVEELRGKVAIGHTRWATHGEPNDVNAHPHTVGAISLVHNGIIENYAALYAELTAAGERFLSQTDSEAAAILVNRYYEENDGDLLSAVAEAVGRLKGSFAFGILCAGFDGLVAVKYKSPVVVGFSAGGTYIASDIPALPPDVKEIGIPDDGTIAVITAEKTEFYDFDLRPVECARERISPGQSQAEKGNYPHFMIKEICECARTVRDTAAAFFRYVDRAKCAQILDAADRIIVTGCGTAYHSGLIAKRFFGERGAFCSVEIASELRYFPPAVTENTVVVAVSQSGETADTVEAVALLKERGAKVFAVTNCGFSAITRVAHVVVPVCAGAEICVAATKSYIGQIAALYLLSRVSGGLAEAEADLEKIGGKIGEVLQNGERAEEIAALCARSRAVFFLGRGADYDAAAEASLKLKEVSYVFSDGYPAGELKHGTLALIDENTLSVFIICDRSVAEKCENAVEQVLSRKGKAAVVTCLDGVAEDLKERAILWRLPSCPPRLAPMVSAVAMQLVAYKTAVALGRDPDKPRNLAKSVTVE